MIITTVETYWMLTINWGWSDIGFGQTHTSLHKTRHGAEQRAQRVMRTAAGTSGVTTTYMAQREGNSYNDYQCGGKEFSCSITAVEVER